MVVRTPPQNKTRTRGRTLHWKTDSLLLEHQLEKPVAHVALFLFNSDDRVCRAILVTILRCSTRPVASIGEVISLASGSCSISSHERSIVIIGQGGERSVGGAPGRNVGDCRADQSRTSRTMAWSFGQVVCGHADDRAEHGYYGFAIVSARFVLLIGTVRRMLEVREIL